MSERPTIFFILALVLCQVGCPAMGDIANMEHYSQLLIDSIVNLYNGNSSKQLSAIQTNDSEFNPDKSILVPASIYPYILLTLWIICIVIVICCCLYCKCQQAEMMTAYNSNNFELQEVHVMDHPLPHVKGCVCLCCLQQQLAKELQLKGEL